MSASENAKSIGTKGWLKPDGSTTSEEEIRAIKVVCNCGWRGHVGQLLGEEDEETLYCPQCRSASWWYK